MRLCYICQPFEGKGENNLYVCDKHANEESTPSYYKEHCSICAKEKKVCQRCGTEFSYIEEIRLIGPYIAVQPAAPELRRKSGLIIPETSWKFWYIGAVAKRGEKEFAWGKKGDKRYLFQHPDVQVGDTVMFEKASLKDIILGGKRFYLLHYYDVQLKVDELCQFLPEQEKQ